MWLFYLVDPPFFKGLLKIYWFVWEEWGERERERERDQPIVLLVYAFIGWLPLCAQIGDQTLNPGETGWYSNKLSYQTRACLISTWLYNHILLRLQFFQWEYKISMPSNISISLPDGSGIQVFGAWFSQWKLKEYEETFSDFNFLLYSYFFVINLTSKIAYTAIWATRWLIVRLFSSLHLILRLMIIILKVQEKLNRMPFPC